MVNSSHPSNNAKIFLVNDKISAYTTTDAADAGVSISSDVGINGHLFVNGDINASGGNLLLGDMLLALDNTRLAYTYTNTSVISVWPSLDITRSGVVSSPDSTTLAKMLTGIISITTSTGVFNFPQTINHFANTGTGISIIDRGPIHYSVDRVNSDGGVIITAANKQSGFITNWIGVGNVPEFSGPTNSGYGVVISNNSTSTVGTYITAVTPIASTSTITGALVVNGGVGIGGNLNVGGGLTVNGAAGFIQTANYANTTARDAAIPSPVAGMIVLTNGIFYGYNGSAWAALG
jgi:hypothetical protein